MNRKDRDRIQYAFDFVAPDNPACDSQASVTGRIVRNDGVVVEFIDLKTRSLREDAIRRVRAHGIFRVG